MTAALEALDPELFDQIICLVIVGAAAVGFVIMMIKD